MRAGKAYLVSSEALRGVEVGDEVLLLPDLVFVFLVLHQEALDHLMLSLEVDKPVFHLLEGGLEEVDLGAGNDEPAVLLDVEVVLEEALEAVEGLLLVVDDEGVVVLVFAGVVVVADVGELELFVHFARR